MSPLAGGHLAGHVGVVGAVVTGVEETIMPAMPPGAAWETGACSGDAASISALDATATTRNFNTPATVNPGRLGLKVSGGRNARLQQTRDHNARRPSCNPVTLATWGLSASNPNSRSCPGAVAGLQQLQAALVQAHQMQHKLMEAQQPDRRDPGEGQSGGGLVRVAPERQR